MDGYTGRHRPAATGLRERKTGPKATCIRFAVAVLLIGAVLASAGFLNQQQPAGMSNAPMSPQPPSLSTSDDGLLNMSAVSPPPSAGPDGAPAAGPALNPTPTRSSTPPAGSGTASVKGGPAGAWSFEEATGTTAADSSGFQRVAMLCDGTARGAGHDSTGGLRLASGNGCAYATGSMLRTDTAFTVSAWVNLDAGAGESVALAQEGTAASGFYLMYDPNGGKWSLRMPRSDSMQAGFTTASSSGPATAGRWTHLVGTYDGGTKQLKLYVDGAPAGSATHPEPAWRALGYFYMGRARHSGNQFYRFQGSLDDVKVFDYAVSDRQASDLFTGKG